jgi:hypothetical protein
MIDLKPVAVGIDAAERLATRLVHDLVVPQGEQAGSDDAPESDWRDYLVGASRAIATNLRNLAVHRSRYRDTRYPQDADARLRVSAGGRPYPTGSSDPRYHEREMELDAAEQGVWVAAGAVLDCLATVLAGLVGLKVNLIRVDFGSLGLPRSDIEGYPENVSRVAKTLTGDAGEQREHQVRALRSLAAAVNEAGPPDWNEWLLAMRNMSVHREHRNEMITFERTRSGGIVFYRLPPRDPSVSNMSGFRTAANARISDFYLFEDVQDLIDGLVVSVAAATAATVEVLMSTLDWRARQADTAFDPASQWQAGGRGLNFEGYGRKVPDSVLKDAVMIVNPLDAARLKAAQLLSDPGASRT